MLVRHGDNAVCLDATHGTNAYDFKLITLLVIDDFGAGIPVCWAISNREDSLVLVEMLKPVRERCGALARYGTDQQQRIEIYHHLQLLLTQNEESQFRLYLQQLLTPLQLKARHFCTYFYDNCCSRIEQWGPCFRLGSTVKTNMFAEAFHRTLNIVHLKHNQNHRLDVLINRLLKNCKG